MIVQVVETGARPTVWSKARRYAPAGARILGEILGEMEWGDEAVVVLDWDNSWTKVPNGAARPIMHIIIRKTLPQHAEKNTVDVSARLDVDDVFGGDAITAEVIIDLVQELKDYLGAQIEAR